MRRLAYLAALALVATLVLAPGAMAQRMMNEDHKMNDNMMASPSATASATPSASATTSATASATATATASATAMTSTARGDHGGGGDSTSASVSSQLPKTGGASLVPLMSVGALALLMGSGLVAARLLRQRT